MALVSNQTQQMAKRLKSDLAALAPEFALSSTTDASGDPVVQVKNGATTIALMAIKRRTFAGFNIVNEISASAGNGFPEHEMWLVVKDDTTLAAMAKLTKAATTIACSGIKLLVEASADLTDIGDESKVVSEIPNDARLGFSGN
jgi:hypothetical protein